MSFLTGTSEYPVDGSTRRPPARVTCDVSVNNGDGNVTGGVDISLIADDVVDLFDSVVVDVIDDDIDVVGVEDGRERSVVLNSERTLLRHCPNDRSAGLPATNPS